MAPNIRMDNTPTTSGEVIKVDENYPSEIDDPPPFDVKKIENIRSNVKFDVLYKISEPSIGDGKFGKVYKAVEKATGHEFAAKFIKIRKEADRKEVEREVSILTSLRHPRIAQIYDAFYTTTNDIVLIMEIVRGGELFDRVTQEDYELSELAVVMIICQLCEAIDYIHKQNILHLDIKPENIMCVTKTGNRIKLIDFGLARHYDGSQELKYMAGTPEFAAPEVIKFENLDYHTDMWSIGVITYILLSGLSPFLGENIGETYCNVERGEWEFDTEFDVVSDEAKDFISKLIVYDQKKRMLPHECLAHPWIAKHRQKAQCNAILEKPIGGAPIDNKMLMRYNARRKFRRMIIYVKFLIEMNRLRNSLKSRMSENGHKFFDPLLKIAEEKEKKIATVCASDKAKTLAELVVTKKRQESGKAPEETTSTNVEQKPKLTKSLTLQETVTVPEKKRVKKIKKIEPMEKVPEVSEKDTASTEPIKVVKKKSLTRMVSSDDEKLKTETVKRKKLTSIKPVSSVEDVSKPKVLAETKLTQLPPKPTTTDKKPSKPLEKSESVKENCDSTPTRHGAIRKKTPVTEGVLNQPIITMLRSDSKEESKQIKTTTKEKADGSATVAEKIITKKKVVKRDPSPLKSVTKLVDNKDKDKTEVSVATFEWKKENEPRRMSAQTDKTMNSSLTKATETSSKSRVITPTEEKKTVSTTSTTTTKRKKSQNSETKTVKLTTDKSVEHHEKKNKEQENVVVSKTTIKKEESVDQPKPLISIKKNLLKSDLVKSKLEKTMNEMNLNDANIKTTAIVAEKTTGKICLEQKEKINGVPENLEKVTKTKSIKLKGQASLEGQVAPKKVLKKAEAKLSEQITSKVEVENNGKSTSALKKSLLKMTLEPCSSGESTSDVSKLSILADKNSSTSESSKNTEEVEGYKRKVRFSGDVSSEPTNRVGLQKMRSESSMHKLAQKASSNEESSVELFKPRDDFAFDNLREKLSRRVSDAHTTTSQLSRPVTVVTVNSTSSVKDRLRMFEKMKK